MNETNLGYEDTNRLKVKDGGKSHANTNQKKAGETKMSEKVHFRAKNVTRNRESFHNVIRLDS